MITVPLGAESTSFAAIVQSIAARQKDLNVAIIDVSEVQPFKGKCEVKVSDEETCPLVYRDFKILD